MKHEGQMVYFDEKLGRMRCDSVNTEPTMTQQQFADECDINNIMRRYQTTGEFTHVTGKSGSYADFSEIKDYHHMVETVRYAQEAFQVLPAAIRARFKNDPGSLLEFLQDKSNMAEAIQLGLVDAPASKSDSIQKNNDSNDAKNVNGGKKDAPASAP